MAKQKGSGMFMSVAFMMSAIGFSPSVHCLFMDLKFTE